MNPEAGSRISQNGNTIPRFTRKRVIVVVIVLSIVMMLFGQSMILHLFPALGFRLVTGRPVPSGVRVTAYASEMNDNLFHPTHYWMLTGLPSGLRQVIVGTQFRESLDDARYSMPDLTKLFGVRFTSSEVIAGYEDEHSGRNRWYCILAGETNALYAH